MLKNVRGLTDRRAMATSPLDKLLASLGKPRGKARVMVVVQTERGQIAVPADTLREQLRKA